MIPEDRLKLDKILGQKLKTYDAIRGEPEIISYIHGTDVYEKLIPEIEILIENIEAKTRRETARDIVRRIQHR